MTEFDEKSNEELTLEWQQNRNDKIYEYLYNRNLPIINNYLMPFYKKYPHLKDDIKVLGMKAFFDMMSAFDESKGAKLMTMTEIYVLNGLREFLRDDIYDVNPGGYVKSGYKDAVTEFNKSYCSSLSLYDTVPGCGDVEFIETLESDDEDITDIIYNNQKKKTLISLLNQLEPTAKYIIETRYGLNDDKSFKTLQEIADELNCSRQRVNQIEEAAILKLKQIKENLPKLIKYLKSKSLFFLDCLGNDRLKNLTNRYYILNETKTTIQNLHLKYKLSKELINATIYKIFNAKVNKLPDDIKQIIKDYSYYYNQLPIYELIEKYIKDRNDLIDVLKANYYNKIIAI